jgi:hypothetical protein
VIRLLVASALLSTPPGGAAPPAGESPAAALARFAWETLKDEPSAEAEDAYKWLFQAARGGEHAAPSEESARAWLLKEWATLGPAQPGEPLLVPLRPDGEVVRLNLRPYRDAGGETDALLAAFLASARSFRPDPALFVEAWRKLGEILSGERHGKVSPAAFDDLDRASEGLGWPARHHSRGYAEARAPAYRVLTGAEAGRLSRSFAGRR